MAPASAAPTRPRQSPARTSTRCSTRIFFTLASRSGTTRIVYDLSKDLLLLPSPAVARLKSRAARPSPHQPPASASASRGTEALGPAWKVGARPAGRKLASSIGFYGDPSTTGVPRAAVSRVLQ